DGMLFALPPAGAERVLVDLPEPGRADLQEREPSLNRQVLFDRAASYFVEEAKRRRPRQVGDLRFHLDEIRMRLGAGQFEEALRRMNKLDDDHLIRWGQSHLLTEWRRGVADKVHAGWQAINLAYLIEAEFQQEAAYTEESVYELGLLARKSWMG